MVAGSVSGGRKIIYLEPFKDRNLRAFGYDMLSEPVRRAAMGMARDSGAPSVYSSFELSDHENQLVTPKYFETRSITLPGRVWTVRFHMQKSL
ncbi:MAG: CHASE domain-containing protein [Magnetococcales bacterium]|nr:CHASE domain-containing protein [Magnetococcales bacterium]MBF0440125.1 CHASE domain-containing protein [Magnetococcales bacterium]